MPDMEKRDLEAPGLDRNETRVVVAAEMKLRASTDDQASLCADWRAVHVESFHKYLLKHY